MPHGMLDPYFQRDPARRLKALRNVLYWKLVERKVVNEAAGLLFTCEEEKLLAREPFRPYRPRQEAVVGLGVEEPPAFTPAMKTAFAAACPDLGKQPYLLFLSRIHPKKGVDLLIRAYVELARAEVGGQESEVGSQSSEVGGQKSEVGRKAEGGGAASVFPALVIAGPLDSAYAREMQQLAADLLSALPPTSSSLPESPDLRLPTSSSSPPPLSTFPISTFLPCILFPGMLTGEAKWGAFHGCDAFILPSHQENFGIAVVEALACGKPVLISKRVNIWREITGGGAAIHAEDTAQGTSELLQEWVRLYSDQRETMDRNAREVFETHFRTTSAACKLTQALIPC